MNIHPDFEREEEEKHEFALSNGISSDKRHKDWINRRWRPLMGWTYMITCVVDFIIFPILWSILQAYYSGKVTEQWQPLTLMGAGLYHIAMGTIIGVTAYGRTKEKISDRD